TAAAAAGPARRPGWWIAGRERQVGAFGYDDLAVNLASLAVTFGRAAGVVRRGARARLRLGFGAFGARNFGARGAVRKGRAATDWNTARRGGLGLGHGQLEDSVL